MKESVGKKKGKAREEKKEMRERERERIGFMSKSSIFSQTFSW